MKKSTKKVTLKKNAKRLLVFGFFSFAIITFVGINIFKIVDEIVDKYREASVLEKKIVALEEEENDLNNEIKKLQDSEYLARYAREKYFYSKNGELIIRLPNEEVTETDR